MRRKRKCGGSYGQETANMKEPFILFYRVFTGVTVVLFCSRVLFNNKLKIITNTRHPSVGFSRYFRVDTHSMHVSENVFPFFRVTQI